MKNLIFSSKLLCTSICIFSGYAVIAHFKEYPIFGIMYVSIFLDLSLAYLLVYEKAFRVPALLAKVKRILKVCARRHGNKLQRKLLTSRVNSIPVVGIKVEDFHILDRTLSPVFIHYVLTNVVSMLVGLQ